MSTRLGLVGLAAVALVASASAANEWFVDDDNYGKPGLDGTTEATAFGTIQDAIDSSSVKNGDTVTVLPGTYDKGFATYVDGTMPAPYTTQPLTNRITITKSITIRSRDGADVTHIVGAAQPAEAVTNVADCGVGPAAIRCVMATVKDTLLQGFTLRDGHVHTVNFGSDNTANQGGGYRGNGTIVDCVISNCVGTRGGAMRSGTAVRCRIVNNLTTSGTAVGRDTTFVNSLIAQNRCFVNPRGNHCFACTFYNCTIVGNADTPFCSDACKLYNTVFACNEEAPVNTTGSSSKAEAYRSAFETNNGPGKEYFPTAVGCAIGDVPHFFAPLFLDYRLVPTSPAVGLGDPSYLASLSLPDGVDPFVDLEGRAIPRTGAINAGCTQAVGPTPVSGVAFDSDVPVMVDGRAAAVVTKGLYAFTDSAAAPQLFHLRPQPPDGQFVYAYQHLGSSDFGNYQEPPLMDDSIWCAFPPTGVCTTKVLVAKTALWVDPTNGVNDAQHGTAAAPLKTIQEAIRRCVSGTLTVVHCAAGDYKEDGEVGNGVLARVYVNNANLSVRIKGAGRGRSFIYGAHDPNSTWGDGRGDNAARCVHIVNSNNRQCVQGFTLVDGATKDGTTSSDDYNGGGFLAHNDRGQLADCTIDNCIGYRGGAVKQGSLYRCIITNCPASSGGMTREVRMYSTLIYGCKLFPDTTQAIRNGPVFGNSCKGRQVTAYGNADSKPWDGSSHAVTNCLFASAPGVDLTISFNSCAVDGTVFGNLKTLSASADPRWFTPEPGFNDPSNGDFTLLAAAKAVDGGCEGDYWRYPLSDVYGNPIRFYRGKPMAGAVHAQPVPSVLSEACATGSYSVTPTLPKKLAPGESVTVTATVTGATRPVFGFRVTGDVEAVVTNTTLTMTFTAPTALTETAIGRFSIEPLVSGDWYVSPGGSDGNDGFSPLTPFATLKRAMEEPSLATGDTVHALPGVYSSGTMAVDGNCSYGYNAGKGSTPVRVRVKGGVTLLADEGPEKTVIKGEFTSDADGGSMNRGKNSVRCAAVEDAATLKGFTLTGGSVTANASDDEVNSGGAVQARVSTTAVISDCIISNNYAYRCAAGSGGHYVRCRILANYSDGNPISIGRACAENCFIDYNWGSKETIRHPNGLFNCTIGIHNRQNQASEKTESTQIQIQDGQQFPARGAFNCLVMGGDATASGKSLVATNCIFLAGFATNALYKGNCAQYTEEEIKLNADGTLGAGSKAIGFGCNDYLAKLSEPAGGDLNGGQRIYNATVDAGCCEFDYRPVFAAAMGGGVTVTNASPDVTLADGMVTLTDGAVISGAWAPLYADRGIRYSCTATASDGTLAGAVGERPLCLSEGSETLSFKARNTTFGFGFGFAGAGAGTLSGFEQYVPGVLLLVR